MLKGVNKQIIEVTDTGNQYINKAILFVDPHKKNYDGDFLVHQAKSYVAQMNLSEGGEIIKPQKPKMGKLKQTVFKLSAGAAIGATVASLLMKL